MSIRQLPDIQLPNVSAKVTFDPPPRALQSWSRNVFAAGDSDVISILDPIGETYDGAGVTVNRVAASLRAIGEKPVTVQINSPGGNYFDGLSIYNLLRAHPRQVTVQVIGIAASAASVIAMAGDEIQIAKAGLMMVHNAQWVAVGDRHAMTEAAEAMAIFDRAMNGLYVDRTALLPAEIAAMMDATTFMSGEEAVEIGFATGLLAADDVPTAIAARAPRSIASVRDIAAVLQEGGVSSRKAKAAAGAAWKAISDESDDAEVAALSQLFDDHAARLAAMTGAN